MKGEHEWLFVPLGDRRVWSEAHERAQKYIGRVMKKQREKRGRE